MANRFHNPRPQFMNATPVVYSAGVLRFYVSGTSTPKNVFANSDLTSASTTITLNSAGRPSQDIFLSTELYKVTLEDSLGNLIWTVDPYMTSDYTTVAKVQGYSGDPNTHVAGTASAGTVPADMVWDRTNYQLYVCTTTGNAAAAVWTIANTSVLDTWTTAGRNVSPTAGVDFGYNTTLNALEFWNGTIWRSIGKDSTVQRLTSGTAATFTPSTGAVRFRIRMVGPGGGGGAQATNSGSAGSADTSFQVNSTGTAWTVVKGSGGSNGGSSTIGGAGGTGGTNGSTGTLIDRANGGYGGPSVNGAGASVLYGWGGASARVPTVGVNTSGNIGVTASANSGGGGSGGGTNATAWGAGGGGGEYMEFTVTGMTTATYTIGTGGAGGSAGTVAGGAGAAGIIIVEEFYS